MSEKTKQSFLNFIFKETVLSGNFWSRGWEGDTLDIPPNGDVIRKVEERWD